MGNLICPYLCRVVVVSLASKETDDECGIVYCVLPHARTHHPPDLECLVSDLDWPLHVAHQSPQCPLTASNHVAVTHRVDF
jgi:hypothetical protein